MHFTVMDWEFKFLFQTQSMAFAADGNVECPANGRSGVEVDSVYDVTTAVRSLEDADVETIVPIDEDAFRFFFFLFPNLAAVWLLTPGS